MHRGAIASLIAGCALVLAVTGATASPVGESSIGGQTYTVLQMNLCLSGYADCYGKVAFPAGVHEAVARIGAARPDAVTLNETCRRDVARIARRTGYRLRFSTVTVAGKPLACVRPGGRGHFGDAVLTRTAIESSDSRDFTAQAGIEWRRWLCVRTRAGVDVCTAHLATRSAATDAQCAELSAVLERRAATRTVIFGGDVNRRGTCAPEGGWTQTDAAAQQAPGLQAVYGTGALRPRSAQVLPAAHTDHDALLVSSAAYSALIPDDLDIRRPDLLGVRRFGTVRWWKDEKGYGRITADDGEVLWAHFSALEMDGVRTLSEGQRVSFVWNGGIQDHGRHAAEEVRVAEP